MKMRGGVRGKRGGGGGVRRGAWVRGVWAMRGMGKRRMARAGWGSGGWRNEGKPFAHVRIEGTGGGVEDGARGVSGGRSPAERGCKRSAVLQGGAGAEQLDGTHLGGLLSSLAEGVEGGSSLRERDREKQRDRETERQRDRVTERQRQRDRETERYHSATKETERQRPAEDWGSR